MQNVFNHDPDLVVEDIDFSDKHMVLILREGQSLRLCSVSLPLPSGKVSKQNQLSWDFCA